MSEKFSEILNSQIQNLKPAPIENTDSPIEIVNNVWVCKYLGTQLGTENSRASDMALRWSARREPVFFATDMLLRWSKEPS